MYAFAIYSSSLLPSRGVCVDDNKHTCNNQGNLATYHQRSEPQLPAEGALHVNDALDYLGS